MAESMRAKMVIQSITKHENAETLKMRAVCKSDPYPEDGSDENNTFAKFSPSASLEIYVANPALIGVFSVDDQFYVDFTPASTK